MENKQKALQFGLTINILLEESIVNIHELAINYNDTLYAYCPKLQCAQWIGICMYCFEDHPNQLKFVNLDELMAIQGSEQYIMIDIVNFKKALITKLSSELNTIFNDCEPEQQQLRQTIQRVIEDIRQKVDLIIIEQQQLDSLEMICKKNNLNNTTPNKIFMVKCNNITECWRGFCPLCRLNVKHSLFLKPLVNTLQPQKNISQFLCQPSRSLELDNSSDYRLVDMYQFQIKIQKYLKEQVYEISICKVQQMLLVNSYKIFIKKNKQFNKNTDHIRFLQQQIDNNIMLKKKSKIILKTVQINNLKIQIELLDLNKIVKQFEEGSLYDIEINCANLSDLTTEQGWKVLKNEFYEQQKYENCSVVSFYGLYNKGKSFLASKLSGNKLSSGYTISTIGLSAFYPRNLSKANSIIFLETAGLERPINHHKKDAIYEKLKKQFEKDSDEVYSKVYEAKLIDRLRTESLIQQFVLNQSHMILIIVDQLSKDEQYLIRKIKTKYQQSEIVIVHNFSKFTRLEEIQKYMQIDIVNSFEIAASICKKLMGDITGSVYIEKRCGDQGQDLPSIVHVIIAQEHSEAGYHYNPFCYQYLVSRMISINQFKKFDIIKSLMTEVEQKVYNLFQLNPEQQNLQYTLKYDTIKNAITTNLLNVELKPFSLDILGCFYFYDQGEPPKYNYQVTDDKLILNIELCYKFELQLKDLQEKFICKCEKSGCSLLVQQGFHDNNQLILLRGKYLGAISPLLFSPTAQYYKHHRLNRFQLIVPVSPMQCIIKPFRPQLRIEQGIAKIEFFIDKQQDLQVNDNL